MGCELPILAYHKVDTRRELGFTSLSPDRFERQIRFLRREGYTSISPPEILDFRESKIKNQKSKNFRPVLITFDDGYEGVYTYAYPILKEHSFTAIIFVTTGYIGKYNNWDASPGPRFKHLQWSHIREMADDGIWFGSHGINHDFLTRRNDSTARYEIEASKKELEDTLGQPIRFFSYPYGDYDDRIMRIVQEAGYEAAFSLRPGFLKAGCDSGSTLVYALPRVAIYLVDSTHAFKAKVGYIGSGSLSHVQKAKNRLIHKCAYANMLVERLRS